MKPESRRMESGLHSRPGLSWLAMTGVIFYAVTVVRNAWLSDDAYITLRTVDNFIHGYGLRWNIDERVQAYTHPLWMFLMSGACWATLEFYFTPIMVSVAVSLAAVWVLARRVAGGTLAAVFAVAVLTLSKAFIDFSTSGLENPLTHLLLGLIIMTFARQTRRVGDLFRLSLLSGLAVLNRMDIGLMLLPLLAVSIYEFSGASSRTAAMLKAVSLVLAGFLPFILWEVFAVIYYGFPFPNTAYAKLYTGIEGINLPEQGFYYLLNSLYIDPLTLIVIAAGFLAPFVSGPRRNRAVSLGILFYLVYTVKIGGDFMSGRYLTAPLFLAVAMIAQSPPALTGTGWGIAFGLATLAGLSSPYPTVMKTAATSVQGTPSDNFGFGDPNGIVDERRYYFSSTGLLNKNHLVSMPDNQQVVDAYAAKLAGKKVAIELATGYYGFTAGPGIHVIDSVGLGDPLLARLPAMKNRAWRIGHFKRRIPEGYAQTWVENKNRIKNRNLAEYYNKLSLVTQADLFTPGRFAAIWDLNMGNHNDLLRNYPEGARAKLADVSAITTASDGKTTSTGIPLNYAGLSVHLDQTTSAPAIELGVDGNDDYRIKFLCSGNLLGSVYLPAVALRDTGIVTRTFKVPQDVVNQKYDEIKIVPVIGDDDFTFGYLKLIEHSSQ